MKKIVYGFAVALFLLAFATGGQTPAKRYTVAFYNVENFFDTIKDPRVMDEEFTPEGPKQWDTRKYRQKLANLEYALFELAAATTGYPTVIGMAEIENRCVLEDLVAQPKLRKADYQIVHYNSPEARGIDVALLYRPDQFTYEGSVPITTVVKGLPGFKTRDILLVWGTIEQQRFCFFVCHWPSRRGGDPTSIQKRIGAAQCVKQSVDSMMRVYPGIKVVIMGDMNDGPFDQSIAMTLGATADRANVSHPYGLYNPFCTLASQGYGTMTYDNQWNLFDNMIVNEALVKPQTATLGLVRSESSKFDGNIFSRPFLLEQNGPRKGFPFRTYAGNVYLGGYSDHLPVYIYLSR